MWETPKIPKLIVLSMDLHEEINGFLGVQLPTSWQIGWFRFKLATCRTAWARQAVIARFVSLPIFILQAQNRLRPSREFSCVVKKCASHVFHSARSAYSCLRPQCGCGQCVLFLIVMSCTFTKSFHGPARKFSVDLPYSLLPTLFDSRGRLGLPWFLYQEQWT